MVLEEHLVETGTGFLICRLGLQIWGLPDLEIADSYSYISLSPAGLSIVTLGQANDTSNSSYEQQQLLTPSILKAHVPVLTVAMAYADAERLLMVVELAAYHLRIRYYW